MIELDMLMVVRFQAGMLSFSFLVLNLFFLLLLCLVNVNNHDAHCCVAALTVLHVHCLRGAPSPDSLMRVEFVGSNLLYEAR